MMAPRSFIAGAKAMGPVLLGIAPFGLVSGVAAVNAGMDPHQAIGMSLLIFAGTSQLAAIDLIAQHASAPIIVLTVAVINVRMVMYSASMAPYLRDLSVQWRSLLSYLLTDHVYALAIAAIEDDDRSVSVKWYVLGLGAAIWTAWQMSTVAGIVLGATVPSQWELEFVVPLTFLAILIPELKDSINGIVAAVSGAVAVLGGAFPMNLSLITAAVTGVVVGTVLEEVGRA